MAAVRRKHALPSRRRRNDEEDEDGSIVGENEEDSLSEGSVLSNGEDDADAEGSDTSEQDADREFEIPSADAPTRSATQVSKSRKGSGGTVPSNAAFQPSTDTQAMMNGLKLSDETEVADEIAFEDMGGPVAEKPVETEQPEASIIRRETLAERVRREHREYLKERDENPAFVPNRGGFFLHDNRAAVTGFHPTRGQIRGAGRGPISGSHLSHRSLNPEPVDQQWAHDLHETTLNVVPTPTKQLTDSTTQPSASTTNIVPSVANAPPNRSFSYSTLLGNVTVSIRLPGATKKTVVPNVAKKQHILLPQHRPPLRRDKPVRISIPDHMPRYIFPSTERSFIFIPRAMRPNQQNFSRGRGRGSFAGSRRTSVYGGSTYSPSVVMSRRSSFAGGATGSGVRTPVGAVPSRPAIMASDLSKPIVRLPPMARSGLPGPGLVPLVGPIQPYRSQMSSQAFPTPEAVIRHSPAIPMHQPRPQKQVSVADIESPARFSFDAPQQQQEQPFHQQVPVQITAQPVVDESMHYNPHSRNPSHPSQPSATPLSHIPDRAIYAPTFQPHMLPPPQGYYPATYPPGTVFYASSNPDVPAYGNNVAPPVMPPTFVPGAVNAPFMIGPPPLPGPDGNAPTGLVAHESNGMVYYYDPSQMQQFSGPSYPSPYSITPAGEVMGMGGMMSSPAQFYYSQAPNGVYYGPQ